MTRKKININERLIDGEVDLSMNDLQDVPVREIATLRNVYSLDLSNNRLITLPKLFPTLTSLTKLDLSKNALKELPDNFGDLSKLKYLDLYQNQLEYLPLSMGSLRDLKWLDLKDNPLVPSVSKVAGMCLDSKECQKCAKDIVKFYSELQARVNTELETRQKQRQRQIEINVQKKQEMKKIKKVTSKQTEKKQENVNVTQVTSNKPNTEAKKQDNSKPGFFKTLFLSFLVASVILFVFTSIQMQHTKTVPIFTSHIFNKGINLLPKEYRTYGLTAGNCIYELHTRTGSMIQSFINYFLPTK